MMRMMMMMAVVIPSHGNVDDDREDAGDFDDERL